MEYIESKCTQCGDKIYVDKNTALKGRALTCSRECTLELGEKLHKKRAFIIKATKIVFLAVLGVLISLASISISVFLLEYDLHISFVYSFLGGFCVSIFCSRVIFD